MAKPTPPVASVLRASLAGAALLAVTVCTSAPAPPPVAPAVLEVELLATDPPLPARLAVGDRLYLRLAYRSDLPVRLQARGWSGGEPRPGGFNGSPAWPATEEGEALAWLFVSEAGPVDQVRVQAGDAAGRGTLAEFSFSVDVEYGAVPQPRTPAPWVASLGARSDALIAAGAPQSGPADLLLGQAIVAAIFALLAAAIALPLWASVRWPSPWRWGAWLAMALIILPVLNIIIGVVVDPTSHNLWPLELLTFALASLALLGVLALLRRARQRRPSGDPRRG